MADGPVNFEIDGDPSGLIAAMRAAEKATGKLGRSVDKLDDTAKESNKTTKKMEQSWGSTASKISAAVLVMDGAVRVLGSIGRAAFDAGRAIFNLAEFSSQYTDKVGLLSAQTGFAAETLIALDFAAQAGGGSIDNLTFGLASFTKRAGDAANLGGASADSFKRLGVEVKDADGNLRDIDDVLRDTLAGISALDTDTQKASASLDLFGTRGGQLVGVLGGSADALDQWSAAARDMGVVIDEDVLQASQELDAALAGLNASLTGLQITMGTEFTPIVRDVIVAMTALAIASTDAFKVVSEGGNILVRAFEFIINDAVGPLTRALGQMLKAAVAVQEALGVETADSTKLLIRALEDTGGAVSDLIEFGFEELTAGMGDYLIRAQRVIGSFEGLESATDETTEAVKEQIEIIDKAALAFERLTDAKQAVIKTEEAIKAAVEESAEAEEERAVNAIDFASQQLSALAGAAFSAFEATKGTAIGEALINTALAITKAFAMFGPPPSPVGILAAANAAAIGAIQIGVISAQKPPSFHIGGVVPEDAPRLPGGGPRDRLAIVEPGERIEPEGGGRQSMTVNVIQLGHRLFDAATMESITGGVLQGLDEPETLGQARFLGAR